MSEQRQEPDLLADLRKQVQMIEALPPMPRAILISHAVPYGRIFRQWNTRGELFVWANAGEVADLPHVKPKPPLPGESIFNAGIPVVRG